MATNENNSLSENTDPIKALYHMVNEDETPLPRCWSTKDKYSFIGLSENNLRVHYKGNGKGHNDAASVRATHPIPASCGLYYYEVKIVSKGRDGFMGIGLSAQGVSMNRLPGWDKNSYGYHGDDGNSFCSSGTGEPYGPTFTTGDVIGCGINLIDNVCFYTKNGHYLGVAFTDLLSNLYPTVGLQTPGEVVDANFGQSPFVFDIGEMMRELRNRERLNIQNFPVADTYSQWQTMLHKMVSTYLVHHGYCGTAEAFARSTSQDLDEELTSIKNRQKIQKLVLAGRLGEAIKTVHDLYPGLLEKHQNLLFTLRRPIAQLVRVSPAWEVPHRRYGGQHCNVCCHAWALQWPNASQCSFCGCWVRQFIEMVNGTDASTYSNSSECISINSTNHSCDPPFSQRSRSPTPDTPPVNSFWTNGKLPDSGNNKTPALHTSVIQSTKNIMGNLNQGSSSNMTTEELNQRNAQESSVSHSSNNLTANGSIIDPPVISLTSAPTITTSSSSNSVSASSATSSTSHMNDSDVDMDFVGDMDVGTTTNSFNESVNRLLEVSNHSNGFTNGFAKHEEDIADPVEEMDVEGHSRKMCRGNPVTIEKMLLLGRELQQMSQNLRKELGKNKQNKAMLQDAFSLLAYNDPWNSPVGWQLDPIQREPVCQALNSAILESHHLPRRPPLEIAISHTKQLINSMSRSGLGSCAFASVESILNIHKETKSKPSSSQSSGQHNYHFNSSSSSYQQ